jgi:ribonuclease HI
MAKCYAVARGRRVGVLRTWQEVKDSTHRFSGAMYRAFSSDAEAKAFVAAHTGTARSSAAISTIESSASSRIPSSGRSFLLRFDGACVGNPGPGGAGALLYGVPDLAGVDGLGSGWGASSSSLDDASGVARGKWEPLWEGASFVGGSTTNNVAEYRGLIMGLDAALRIGVAQPGARLCVQGDSELIIRQVLGEYEVKAEHLKPLRREAASLIERIRQRRVSVTVSHVLRHCNSEADRLSNVGLGRRPGNALETPHSAALSRFGCGATDPDVIELLD